MSGSPDNAVVALDEIAVIDIALQTDGLSMERRYELLQRKLLSLSAGELLTASQSSSSGAMMGNFLPLEPSIASRASISSSVASADPAVIPSGPAPTSSISTSSNYDTANNGMVPNIPTLMPPPPLSGGGDFGTIILNPTTTCASSSSGSTSTSGPGTSLAGALPFGMWRPALHQDFEMFGRTFDSFEGLASAIHSDFPDLIPDEAIEFGVMNMMSLNNNNSLNNNHHASACSSSPDYSPEPQTVAPLASAPLLPSHPHHRQHRPSQPRSPTTSTPRTPATPSRSPRTGSTSGGSGGGQAADGSSSSNTAVAGASLTATRSTSAGGGGATPGFQFGAGTGDDGVYPPPPSELPLKRAFRRRSTDAGSDYAARLAQLQCRTPQQVHTPNQLRPASGSPVFLQPEPPMGSPPFRPSFANAGVRAAQAEAQHAEGNLFSPPSFTSPTPSANTVESLRIQLARAREQIQALEREKQEWQEERQFLQAQNRQLLKLAHTLSLRQEEGNSATTSETANGGLSSTPATAPGPVLTSPLGPLQRAPRSAHSSPRRSSWLSRHI